VLLDSVFLDVLDSDAAKMQRINQLIADNPRSPEFGLRPIEALVLRPSVDLGAIAREYLHELPRVLRRVLLGLGSDENNSAVTATLLFQPAYIQRLLEIGERDGDARRDELGAFFGFTTKSNAAGPVTPPALKINGANGHAHPVEKFPVVDRTLAAERTGTD
jgi:NTE family protein